MSSVGRFLQEQERRERRRARFLGEGERGLEFGFQAFYSQPTEKHAAAETTTGARLLSIEDTVRRNQFPIMRNLLDLNIDKSGLALFESFPMLIESKVAAVWAVRQPAP